MTLSILLKKYNFQIKYGLLIVTIFSMIAAIRVYINYLNVEISIENTKNNVIKMQEQIDYLKNFYEPYLKSEDAQKFFAHENNMLLTGEIIIRFTKPPVALTGEMIVQQTGTRKTLNLSEPQDAWQYFFQQKFQKLLQR